MLGYPLPHRRQALIGSHKTRCARRMSLWYLEQKEEEGGGGQEELLETCP